MVKNSAVIPRETEINSNPLSVLSLCKLQTGNMMSGDIYVHNTIYLHSVRLTMVTCGQWRESITQRDDII